MIAAPHNDHACLDALTEHVISLVESNDPKLVALAEAHTDPDALAAWMRTLPQRDDHGRPEDGPKIDACQPAQRFQVDSIEPNCFERTGQWVGASEMMDPTPVYRFATVKTSNGLHTFPTRDGAPVILDPRQSRNALYAGLFRENQARNAGPMVFDPLSALGWVTELAVEPALGIVNGLLRVRNADRAMRALFVGRPLCVGDVTDVVFTLALADREARQFGPSIERLVRTTTRAVDNLDAAAGRRWLDKAGGPRNLELSVGGVTLSPDMAVLGSLARVGGRIAGNIGLEALKLKLASMGVGAPIINSLEHELNREGLSLGPFARPPAMLGTLGALSPESIAGRWLAKKL